MNREKLFRIALGLCMWLILATAVSAQQNQDGNHLVFLPLIMKNGCDFFIETNVDKADMRTDYKEVKPGDTVCIRAGKRDKLALHNFQGTPERPIYFRNFGGKVIFNKTNNVALRVRNGRYLHISGSGEPSVKYGFLVDGTYVSGVRLNEKSSDIELHHFEITNTTGAAIMAKTEPTCSDGSNNAYDFDGDGKEKNDLDDIVNRDTFRQYNTILHDNYLHNVGHEGFYVGGSHFEEGQTFSCKSGTETVLEPLLEGVRIYNNVIEDAGWDGLQVSATVEGTCEIFNNRIYRDSLEMNDNQRSSIGNGKGGICDIYGNFIKDGTSKGIRLYLYGNVNIYNNVIINAGQGSNKDGTGIWIFENFGDIEKNANIFNNTIVNPSAYGIRVDAKKIAGGNIVNNIIVSPGFLNEFGDDAYISIFRDGRVKDSHNLTTPQLSLPKFTNPAADDYSLKPNSPAIDAGVSISDFNLNLDFLGNDRPHGDKHDIGAYEFNQ
ncbi:MAG: right-handed parallel beta-helix repeat-containing protein [Anaerolineae bacterium]|nr:right-handed parallel beta-helix repeat-containing protein [Anaerolineae bacterium]